MQSNSPRNVTERRRMEEIMRNLSVRFASIYGTEFFNRVCAHVREVLGADYTFVGKLIPDKHEVRVIGGMGRGEALEPFDYALEGSPCVEVIGKQACVYESKVQELFPQDRILADMSAEGYAGIPLYSRSGDPLGIFVTMSTGPMADKQLAIAMMTGYSERVSAEIERTDAEAALRMSEERFSKAFQHTSDSLAITSLDGMKLVEVNEGFTRLTGFKRSEAIGKSTEELGLWANPTERTTFLETLDARGAVEDMEATFKTRTGEERSISFSSRSIDLADQPHLITVARDITERKQAEASLRESEDNFGSLSRAAFEGIGVADAGRLIHFNDQLADMFGYEPSELVGKNILDLVAPKHHLLVSERIESGYEPAYEFLAQRKDGSTFPVQVQGKSTFFAGKLRRIAALRDITESKQAEEALRASERTLSEAQRIAHIGSWLFDIQENSAFWSDETCRIFGLPVGTPVTHEEFLQFVHPGDRERVEQTWRAALQGGLFVSEYRIVVDGEVKWLADKSEIEFDKDGRPLRGIGMVHDITENKLAIEALLQKDRDIRKAYANVFSAVTDEKLLILTPEEIAAAQGEPQGEPYVVSSFEHLAASRAFLRSTLEIYGLAEDDLNSLIFASGEAVTNGVKHAGSCEVQVYSLDGTVQLRISDSGPGIDFSDLPKAALLPGFSTKKSLGMGFAVILNICDRVLLATGPEGTTLVLETGGKKEEETIDDILARGLLKAGAG